MNTSPICSWHEAGSRRPTGHTSSTFWSGKLQKHGGNAHASLAAIPDDIKRSLAALDDDDIQRSLAGGLLAAGSQTTTIEHTPDQAERYRRLRLHATGGIGRVWLAHDRDLGRDVALKELLPERAVHATLAARFLQEAKITGQLEHPGIIPVYELVRESKGQQPFYTMRFVRGRTLSAAARDYHNKRLAGQADALELPALLNAFVTVCNTVAYAHARGVIHRDLKGQNVIMGDFGEVVVLDWGLAKLLGQREGEAHAPAVVLDEVGADSGYTVPGQALGTPAYMAPEQAAGRVDQIEQRTDVYGLGAILYEILTGTPPFAGDSTEDVLRKVREEAPASPRQLWADVPAVLEVVCLRALAKHPADRPAAAADLALAVQGWQEFERRKAEEALRESEALYQSLVECLPCCVVCKDLDGRFTFANQKFFAQFGTTLEAFIGKTDFDVFPRELAEKYRRDDRAVLDSGQVLDIVEEHVTPKGEKLYVQVMKTPLYDLDGNPIGIQGIFWDVTERRCAEEELRKSRERYELAVMGSQDGLWDWNLETGEIYLSGWYKSVLGWEEHEFPANIGEWERRLHPDDREPTAMARQAHLEGRTRSYETEFRLLHKDGSYRWVRSRGVAVSAADGRPCRMAGSHEDITDRKRALEELAYERNLLRILMDTSSDGIYFKDRDGRYVRVNKGFAERLGLRDATEVLCKTDADYFAEEYVTQTRADEREILQTGRPVAGKEEKQTWLDGRTTWVSTTKVAVRDPDGECIGILGVSRDITER